jgi:hypothetical protein
MGLKLVAAAVLCLATATDGALAQDQSQSQPKTAAPPLVAPLVNTGSTAPLGVSSGADGSANRHWLFRYSAVPIVRVAPL